MIFRMPGFLLAPLMTTPGSHFDPGKTRLEPLTIMLAGLANGRTVNLSHLASQFPGKALHASGYRRMQRFFSTFEWMGMGVPLMWSFPSHRGNSSTPQPIDLIELYLRVFGHHQRQATRRRARKAAKPP